MYSTDTAMHHKNEDRSGTDQDRSAVVAELDVHDAIELEDHEHTIADVHVDMALAQPPRRQPPDPRTCNGPAKNIVSLRNLVWFFL